MIAQPSPSLSLPRIPERTNEIHVLTLTPFFPTSTDDAFGCFVAEPLPLLNEAGVHNFVTGLQPVHRGTVAENPAGFPANWIRYFCIPGALGAATAGTLAYWQIRSRLRRLVAQQGSSLIHAHAPLPCGHLAFLLSQDLAIPYVVSVHGLDVFSTEGRTARSAERCQRTTKTVLKSASRVICVSRHVEDRVLSGCPAAKTSVVYNGVNPNLFFPADVETESKPTLLSVGDLIESKGHALVIRALAQVSRSYPGLRYLIVGDGPARSSLHSLAQKLGISAHVCFLGRQPRHEVARIIRSATVFVLPSRFEALGCVYLEAMATGKPVIACRGQGIEEIVEHGQNGLLIPPENLDDLVSCLDLLLKDLSLRIQVGRRAREIVLGRLTLDDQARQMARIYQECLP